MAFTWFERQVHPGGCVTSCLSFAQAAAVKFGQGNAEGRRVWQELVEKVYGKVAGQAAIGKQTPHRLLAVLVRERVVMLVQRDSGKQERKTEAHSRQHDQRRLIVSESTRDRQFAFLSFCPSPWTSCLRVMCSTTLSGNSFWNSLFEK